MPKRSTPTVASVQQTPQLPVEGPAVSVGQHKIFPIHPHEPKTTVIPNPAVPFVPQTHNPGPTNNLIGTFDFVCEDDVRKALEKNKIIGIHSKTIITPSARDLAGTNNVFKKVD